MDDVGQEIVEYIDGIESVCVGEIRYQLLKRTGGGVSYFAIVISFYRRLLYGYYRWLLFSREILRERICVFRLLYCSIPVP